VSIELRNLTKRFDDVVAVDQVSFTVAEGELVALLGPSGGGKTTVLRMIAGLELPTSGDLLIRGQRVNDVPVQKRNIGFVFQGYALFRTMSVFDNIAFGLSIRKWSAADTRSRVEELIGILSLGGLEKRLPHQLSGGQRQRVAIARALASRPGVLLLDEPFAAVDAKIRQELREWLVRLQDELNVTTVFVTHDQEEAMEVSSRIVIFSRGRLEQIGTPQAVYEQPTNEFVARFIGVLNVLELTVERGAARVGHLSFPVPGIADGQSVRIGFRPYAVRVSRNPGQYAFRATLKHIFFLGVMLRIELVTPEGLTLRVRISKEEFTHLGLVEDEPVSFYIREYRILGGDGAFTGQALSVNPQGFGDGI
jgi:sulfate transport system ATP-binding protein